VEDIIEGHENAKEAKIKLKKYKQRIGKQYCFTSLTRFFITLKRRHSNAPTVVIFEAF